MACVPHITIAKTGSSQSGIPEKVDCARDILSRTDRQDGAASKQITVASPQDFNYKVASEGIFNADCDAAAG
jgi:hypothetical protein